MHSLSATGPNVVWAARAYAVETTSVAVGLDAGDGPPDHSRTHLLP